MVDDERGRRIRRTIIDIAKRRQRPGTGSASIAPDHELTGRWPTLTEILRELRWAVAGAVATRLYTRERATPALDILVAGEDVQAISQRLREAGPAASDVRLVLLSDDWVLAALDEARDNIDSDGNRVLTLPYLVLMKLSSSRSIDMGDLTRMLGAADDAALDRVREVVGQYRRELTEDLESLIQLGKLEAPPPE